ncbi:MAG: discoidin domain-containing protein [Clostridiaceae bacterium]
MKSINLIGNWLYELDKNECGIEEEWFKRTLSNAGFSIPGTTAENNIGNPVIIEKKLTKQAIECLRQEKQYIGVAWYQTTFVLDDIESFESISLFLERIMFESQLWIDNAFVGKQDSLSTPHCFDITKFVELGKKHKLTIRINNKDIYNIGPYPSAYTDQTQTIWNGIVGRAELQISETNEIKNLIIGTDYNKREIKLKFDLKNSYKDDLDGVISVTIVKDNVVLQSNNQNIKIEKNQITVEITLNLNNTIELWDEICPNLYNLNIHISGINKDKQIDITCSKNIGFSQMHIEGNVLKVNGIQRFLRGNIDCCIYPLTGYPPMNKESWEKVLLCTKNYGLNHVRFHSWCPPEIAFEVADELGIYLQIEGPVWMDSWTEYPVGKYDDHYTYLPEEARRIIEEYSWHPSFCMFSNGNELNGDFKLLEDIIIKLKKINPYLIYTLSTNWDREVSSEDDVFIAQSAGGIGVRGQYFLDDMVYGTTLNYDKGISSRNIPVISHEVGQYVVYPNINEIPKYTGVLKPVNLEVIRDDLEKKGLLKYVEKYVQCSGELSKFLYKAEIEAALRTKDMAGIQLLGLNDFPGQSTATIGLLDSFFESKGIVTPGEFRSFCNKSVPLIVMPKFIYSSNEDFLAEVQIAHYGLEPMKNITIQVDIENAQGSGIFRKVFKISEVEVGLFKDKIFINEKVFVGMQGRNRCKVNIKILHTDIENNWDIWVYEEETKEVKIPNLYHEFSNEAINKLENGEIVVIVPNSNKMKYPGASTYFPVFWSPVHFASKDPCGISIDNEHPFFKKYFPCRYYGDYEWKVLLENATSIYIDYLNEFEPLTMLIPNFYNNHKYTNLLEAKVSNGKVIICCIDIESHRDKHLEIAYFKKALHDYINSKEFNPSQQLTVENIKELFLDKNIDEDKEDVAVNKPSLADSEKSLMYSAFKGNDGNSNTAWCAADGEEGHYWQVDLEKVYSIMGTKVVFNENENYLYVIHTSLDGIKWNIMVNKTGQVGNRKIHSDNFETQARFIKITYNGLKGGIWAGHEQFSVYVK